MGVDRGIVGVAHGRGGVDRTSGRLRIAVVESEDLARALLACELERASSSWTVQSWTRAADAAEGIAVGEADLVVVDAWLRDGDGLTLAATLQNRDPHLRVLMLASEPVLPFARRSHHPSAQPWSFVSKKSTLASRGLVRAVRATMQGRVVIDTAVTKPVRKGQDGLISRLSLSQLEVLRLVVEGKSNGAVAHQLGLTPKGVEYHLRSIYRLLGVNDKDNNMRVAAVLLYLREFAPTQMADQRWYGWPDHLERGGGHRRTVDGARTAPRVRTAGSSALEVDGGAACQ